MYSINVYLNEPVSAKEVMIFKIPKEYTPILFKAINEAKVFAKELNIDLSHCDIEFLENVLCKDILCYLIWFCPDDRLNRDWLEAPHLNDISVFISKESKEVVLITQSR